MTRKKNSQKKLWLDAEDKKRSDELKENIRLGLTDGDIYGKGLTSYESELETIRRGFDNTPKKIKPAVPEESLRAIRQHATDEKEQPFRTPYQLELARIRGERVPQFDRYGFPKYPRVKPEGEVHALDSMYAGGPAPPEGLLEFFTLSRESWFNLLESERLELARIYEEKLQYGAL